MPEAQVREDPSRESVLEALHEVIDPELGFNIVDLGLIYALEVADGVIAVTMTMTTPGCPAQDYIVSGVQDCGHGIAGIADVNVIVVWDPLWSPQKMTRAAKDHFGIPDEGDSGA